MEAAAAAFLIMGGLGLGAAGLLDQRRDLRASVLSTLPNPFHNHWFPLAMGLSLAGAILGFVLGRLAGLAADTQLIAVFGLALIGGLVPWALAERGKRLRVLALDRGVADAAGLIAVTVKAGLGLDAAVELTADEIDGPLGDELALLSYQARLGMTRHETLDALRTRCPTPNVDRLVGTLQHADQLGAPIGAALTALSEDCRARRYQQAREEAAKLPVKILFPVIFLIFPPMMVVLIGPAMADIAKAFSA